MPTIAIYAVIALAALAAFGGFVAYERKAGADKVRAELEPKLTACEGQIATQNAAIEAMRAEGAKKQATAAAALAKAEVRAKVWDADAKRLRGILAGRKSTDDQSCAGAWSEIRKP